MSRPTLGDRIYDCCSTALVVTLALALLYPFLHVAFASISQPSLLVAHTGLLLWPCGVNLGAYARVFNNPLILTGFANSAFNVAIGTLYNMGLTCLGAYVLSRKYFRYRGLVMKLIIFQMYFGGSLIPFYLLFRGLGLLNSRLSVILSVGISSWNLIILRTAFIAIPGSMEESARIDGAGEWMILWRIILPLSKAVLAVVTLYYAVARWNEWFYAMILLRDRELYPLQLVLREVLIQNNTNIMVTDVRAADKEMVSMTVKYATIIITTLPILALYPFLQKYFEKGIMIGSLKG